MKGKVAVTGASGGLGYPLVLSLARLGYGVLAGYHGHSVPAGSNIEPRRIDVRDPRSVDAFFQGQAPLRAVVICHGITSDSLGTKMPDSEWDAVLRVNLTGSFYCLKAGVPEVMDGGAVVVCGSVAVDKGLYGAANYAASKTGLEGLVGSFALENPRLRFHMLKAAFHDAGMGARLPPKVKARAIERYGAFRSAEDFAEEVTRLVDGV